MNYSPQGMRVWDAWYVNDGTGVHMYHLQAPRAAKPEGNRHDYLGHAYTSDLVNWEERDVCLGPDPGNSCDDLQLWTGCTFHHEDRNYLYYTMRGSASKSLAQAIGLAVSENYDHFTRYEGNPVLIPSGPYYVDRSWMTNGILDCRDLTIVKAPDRKGFYGYYATRKPAPTLVESSVIACAYSEDLYHWENLAPAFSPEKYACIEVPDVFYLDGKWYLTCLAGNCYGNRGIFSDRYVNLGTVYAVSDNPRGPFVELDRNVLVGGAITSPTSCRSVDFQGVKYVLYTDRERMNDDDGGSPCCGCVTTPKRLVTKSDYLFAAYSPLIEKNISRHVFLDYDAIRRKHDEFREGLLWQWRYDSGEWELGDCIRGGCRTGWNILDLCHPAESYIVSTKVRLEGCYSAGFCIRLDDQRNADGFRFSEFAFAGLNPGDGDGSVSFEHSPNLDFVEKREIRLRQGETYELKVVNRKQFVEIYVDDLLYVACTRYKGMGGSVGLYVDRGQASFTELSYDELTLDK